MLENNPVVRFQLMWHFLKVKHPKVALVSPALALAVAQGESGAKLDSPLALNANNIFGMQYPNGRAAAGTTTAIGKVPSAKLKGVFFAVFKSQWSAIDDWMFWLENWNLTNDALLEQFIRDKRYTKDAGYYDKWSKLVANLRPQMISPAALIGGAALGGTALVASLSAAKKILK